MGRVWHKVLPPKKVQEEMNIYRGKWLPLMDRAWESEDGYSVMSRKIKTSWGPIEHVTILKSGGISWGGAAEVPWSVKQEIKDELFGFRATAIEVYPAKKHMVDVCDVYHLWVLPPDMNLPFGIHPLKDPMGTPIERGYDFDIKEVAAWLESSARKEIMGNAGIQGHNVLQSEEMSE